jgi:hypothetical protein
MIVSLPIGDKGVGLFVHDVMGNFPILKVLTAFPKNAVSFMFNSNCCYDEEIVLADCTMNNLQPQSGVDMSASNTATTVQEGNVGFLDEQDEVITSIPHDMSYLKVDNSQNVDLGQYLGRPVQIFSKNWQIGTNLTAATSTFNPWYEYFSKTSIKKKLDNYYLLRCNLHLKFVINASPFYYGCCMVAYQPFNTYDPAIILTNASRDENVPLSQRPHLYLYPQNCQGGEMILPFLNNRNWIDAASAVDLLDMGIIDLQSLTVLRNSNGLTTETINIKVYAWTEDLEVAGPTIKLAVQGGKDEYSHGGTISKPASAIARSMGKLGKLPVIGPFATATSYAAGAVADIASLFGYTNVPVIDDVHAFRSKPYPNLASTDIGTPVEKLTLDAKNELSIDPKICGANVDDELLIAPFCQRESFLFRTTWAASDATDTGLFFSKVSPNLYVQDVLTNQSAIYGTPMSHVAKCFKYWRGDIKYVFKFICSPYHKGRVRINWDPIGGIGTSGDYTTETYTRIVDISEETEVSICVPYTQAASYLQNITTLGENFAKTSTSTSGLGTLFNGTITVRVLTEQSSPSASADIDLLVFVSACDNIEFAGPIDISGTYSPYTVQSGTQYDVDISDYEIGLKPSVADPNTNLVYMGESCVSLRQLMRRTTKYKRTVGNLNSSTESIITTTWLLGRNPEYPGFDPTGNDTAVGLTALVSKPYNWVSWSATTWFSQCFIGSRGSYNYVIAPQDLNNVVISTSRSQKTRGTPITVVQDLPLTNRTDFIRGFSDSVNYPTGMSGLTLVNQASLAGDMVSLPMYSEYKFLSNNPIDRTDGDAIDGTLTDTMAIVATTNAYTGFNAKFLAIDTYFSAGTDFSLVFFLNVPTVYVYTSLPLAV